MSDALGDRLAKISAAFFERYPHLRPGMCRCDRELSAGPPWHEQGCPCATADSGRRVEFEPTEDATTDEPRLAGVR